MNFFLFKSSYNIISLFIILCFFLMITNGNTLYGVLTARVSLMLGEMAYSLYLLHGMVLFICFKFILDFNRASHLSTIEHWGVISLCSIILVLISFLTYSLIEKPAMKKVSYFSDLVRRFLKSNGKIQSKPSEL
jgi:peptidoglycan/LPS O-acetylase OafA/YrhL